MQNEESALGFTRKSRIPFSPVLGRELWFPLPRLLQIRCKTTLRADLSARPAGSSSHISHTLLCTSSKRRCSSGWVTADLQDLSHTHTPTLLKALLTPRGQSRRSWATPQLRSLENTSQTSHCQETRHWKGLPATWAINASYKHGRGNAAPSGMWERTFCYLYQVSLVFSPPLTWWTATREFDSMSPTFQTHELLHVYAAPKLPPPTPMFPLSTGNFCKVQTGRVWALLEQALVTGLPVMALQDLAQSWKAAGLPPMTPGQPQSHHYPNVKLQQTSLLCNKSILIWASLEKKKKLTNQKQSKPKPSHHKKTFSLHTLLYWYLVLQLVKYQFQCKTENPQSHSYSEFGL